MVLFLMVYVIVVHYLRVNNSSIKEDKLDPWFITVFSDAESNFGCVVAKSDTIKLGWQVRSKFAIKLHKKDLNILEQIFKFFGVGKIYISGDVALFEVTKLYDLTNVIIPHFKTYPLVTKKIIRFYLVLWRS